MAGALLRSAAAPRETYNVAHRIPWHWQVPAYLVTKAAGAGLRSPGRKVCRRQNAYGRARLRGACLRTAARVSIDEDRSRVPTFGPSKLGPYY